MKANIEKLRDGERTGSCRKEKNFTKQWALYSLDQTGYKGEPCELVCVREYQTDSRAYACIWIHGAEVCGHGGGYAGGYGYHMGSAAVEVAIHDAGIILDTAIGGRGDEAIKDAIKAIAEAVGSHNYFVGEAHA